MKIMSKYYLPIEDNDRTRRLNVSKAVVHLLNRVTNTILNKADSYLFNPLTIHMVNQVIGPLLLLMTTLINSSLTSGDAPLKM